MADKPKFDLNAVRGITEGSEAKRRKAHNKKTVTAPSKSRPQVQATGTSGQTDYSQSAKFDVNTIRKLASGQRPRPGEILSAQAPPPEQRGDDRVRAFLRVARQRFSAAAEAEQKTRTDALDDLEFRTGEQWPHDIQTQRTLDGRPCLTINRLPQFIRQVTNEQRQQRPSIQVNPVGDGADQETAEAIQGIIRHIEINSDAEIAYDTAFDHCVTSGFGFWRILTDYVDDKSFDQEILIKRIKNPFTVYFDPSAIEPDYSDARWCFIIEDLSRDEYEAKYPDSEFAGLKDFQSVGDQFPDWAGKDTIRIAEYFHVEEEKRQLVRLEDGTILDSEELPGGEIPENAEARDVLDRRVVWSKINAAEIFQERDWTGYWIPVVPVLGDDLDVNGKRHLAGLVRSAKDPQRMYNYWNSSATERIALSPKAPFIGAEGQFENHEGQWATANQRNFSYLEYKPISVGGTAVAAPARNVVDSQMTDFAMMLRQSDNDLKATTGIYDASLGEKGPDQSGKAILARQKQSDVATLNFNDNLSRSMRHTGRMLIDLIPHIYDAPRVQRIINPDQSVTHVGTFNSQTNPGVNPKDLPMMQGIKKIYDLGVGRYDVTVSVGPSYQSKRQEAVSSLLAFMQAVPAAAPFIADLVARNSDWPSAKEIADRLKKMLPPQLQDQDDQDPEAQMQRVQAQLQQLSQQHGQLVQALQAANQTIEQKQVEGNIQLQIAKINAESKVAVAEITAKVQTIRAQADQELKMFQGMHDAAHEVATQAAEHGHEQVMAKHAAEQQPTNGGTAQ